MLKCALLFYLLTSLLESSNTHDAGYPGGCTLNVTMNPETAPLIVNSDYSFPAPNGDGLIYYGWAEPYHIACPGGQFTPSGIHSHGQRVNCRSGTNFNIKSIELKYHDIKCTLGDITRPTLVETFNNLRARAYCVWTAPVNVGYKIGDGFAPVYSVCFDRYHSYTLLAQYNITRNTRLIPKRPEPLHNFYLFDLYETFDIRKAYENITLRFESLGLSQYLDDVNFLTAGHLAAYDEFVYPFQRDATYHYVNTAPQWNSFDKGNWKTLEDGIISLVDGLGGDATVLTGTLKVATLTNSSGVPVEIYLFEDRNFGTKVPVPRWFWKMVYFKESNFGAIFFGYNNPYVPKFTADAEFLTQICYTDIFPTLKTSWLLDEIDSNSASLGYMYACPLHRSQIIDEVISTLVSFIIPRPNSRIPEVFSKGKNHV